MDMTMHFGWWTLPFTITLVSMCWAIFTPAEPTHGDYSLSDPMPLVRFVGALILSLTAWLIWALAA